VPSCLKFLESIDGIVQLGLPGIMLSGVVLLLAALFLLARRIFDKKVVYISQAADYFPLFLIIAIAATGISMRYFTKVDIIGVKTLTMGLVTFHPTIPEGVGGLFYAQMLYDGHGVNVVFVTCRYIHGAEISGVSDCAARRADGFHRFPALAAV